jgi:bacterioferritin-associated ferredoxin
MGRRVIKRRGSVARHLLMRIVRITVPVPPNTRETFARRRNEAMIVCLCHRVTESQITRHARAGCASFEALQDELRVATACGVCLECARDTFDAAHASCGSACSGRPQPTAHVSAFA